MKKEKAVILTVLRDNELKAVKKYCIENNKTLPKKLRDKKSKKMRLKLSDEQVKKRLKVNGPKLNWSRNIKFAL